MTDFIEQAQEALKTHKFRSTQVPELVLHIIKEETWKHRDPSPKKLDPKEFEFFPEFVESVRPWGLQTDFAEVEAMCKGFVQIEMAIANLKSKKGLTINDEKLKAIKKSERQRNLTKLKEVRPDLFKKVEKNEISVYKAMIEAGLKKQPTKIQKSPEGFANYILHNFSTKQKSMIIDLLKNK